MRAGCVGRRRLKRIGGEGGAPPKIIFNRRQISQHVRLCAPYVWVRAPHARHMCAIQRLFLAYLGAILVVKLPPQIKGVFWGGFPPK